MSNIVVTQPLHHPAEFVAYGTTPTSCYGEPRFLGEYTGTQYDGLVILGYDDVQNCGKMIEYAPCAGGASLFVVYDNAATPHNYVKFGASCYSFSGTAAGSHALVLAANVTPVPGCSDPACTSVDPEGPSMVYYTQSGQEVGVHFEHLDVGIPHYGVVGRKVDSGLSGLSEGTRRLRFTQSRLYVVQAHGSGTLMVRIEKAHFFKRLIVARGGAEIVYKLSAHDERLTVPVETDDILYLDAAGLTGRLQTFAVNALVQVSWEPYVVLPRLYDTGTLGTGGVVQAVGFCGLTPHQTYTFFGTLPADTSTSGLVNPDTVVTVQGAAQPELLLLRNKGEGDAVASPNLSWYAGESLNAPVLFRFYAGREAQGGHGEMDVWLDTDGAFPDKLSLDAYRAIAIEQLSYRKLHEAGDLRRGTLEVQASDAVFYLPQQYRGLDGQLLTFHSAAGTVVHQGGTYTLIGSDPGLSFTVL